MRVCRLRVNKTKRDTEKVSNSNYFGFRVKNRSKFNERDMFGVSLKKFDLYLNSEARDNIDLRS